MNEKNGMILKKLLIIAITVILIACASYYTLSVKKTAIDDVYETVQFSLTEVEAKQYVNRIEFGLRYGKQLDKYYGLDELLKEMHLTSSYLQGVYVVDNYYNTLSSSTGNVLPQIDGGISDLDSGEFRIKTDYGITYSIIKILDSGGEVAGHLILKLKTDTAGTLVEADRSRSFWRTISVAAFFAGIAIIFFVRFISKIRRAMIPVAAAAILVFTLITPAADLALESYWAKNTIQVTTERSVQRIAQVLQKQIDSVVEMGADYDDIGNLEVYFSNSAANISSVESFSLDTENKVKAVVSSEYCNSAFMAIISGYLIAFAYIAGTCVVVWGGTFGIWLLATHGITKRKKETEFISAKEKQSFSRRKDKQERSPHEVAAELLLAEPLQNILLLQSLRLNYYKDLGIYDEGVRLYDKPSKRYMFYARKQATFDALFKEAASIPVIFFLSTDDARVNNTEYSSQYFSQFTALEHVHIPQPNVPFEFSPLTLEDLDFVYKTYKSDEFNREYIIDRIQNGISICARKNGSIAGYVMTHSDGEDGPMYVSPEYRKNGLGDYFVASMTNKLLDNGLACVGHINDDNKISMRIHYSFGYIKCEKHVSWSYSKALCSVSV